MKYDNTCKCKCVLNMIIHVNVEYDNTCKCKCVLKHDNPNKKPIHVNVSVFWNMIIQAKENYLC